MENINDCYELIKLIANKNQQGFISPTQFNRAWDAAEHQRWKEGDAAYAATRKLADDLDVFLVRVSFVPTATVPFWTRPAKMARVTALLAEFDGGLVDVEEITHGEIGGRLRNALIAPSLEYPAVVFGAGQMEVYPPTVPRVVITYLRYPTVGKWVGTTVNGRPVYDPVNSVQPEWKADNLNGLCLYALAHLGMNLKAQDLVQYTQLKKQEQI